MTRSLLPATLLSLLSAVAVNAQSNSGCGKNANFLGIGQNSSLTSSGVQRHFTVHLPLDYDKNTQHPVIFGFHGSPGVGVFFEADTRLDLANFTSGKIMVYPDGINGSWAGASYSKTTPDEDLTFVDDMITDLNSQYCIDNTRLYATGLSNGGGFVNVIACNNTVGGKFAAFAPASGAYYGYDLPGSNVTCTPAKVPVPIIAFHGGADTTVPYGGGKGDGGQLPNITDWFNWWAAMNNCTNETTVESFNNDVQHYSWTCNGINEATQLWKVDDMKHDWPSEYPNFSQLAAGDKPTHIEANTLILAFFDRFTRTTPAGIVTNTTSFPSGTNSTSGAPNPTSTSPSTTSSPSSTASGHSGASLLTMGPAGFIGVVVGMVVALCL